MWAFAAIADRFLNPIPLAPNMLNDARVRRQNPSGRCGNAAAYPKLQGKTRDFRHEQLHVVIL